MFESLVSQVAGRFGLTDEKTKQLLGLLIGLIFNERRGGPSAFLQSFRDKGLGDVVASWLSSGDNLPINGSQISNVLGSEVINAFGNKLGLPGATVSDASAALLPTAVANLASDGTLEVGALDRVKGWFGSLWDDGADAAQAAAYGTGAAAAAATAAAAAAVTPDRDRVAPAATAARPASTSYAATETKSGGGWWKWLLPLLALLIAIWAFRSCSNQETVDPAATEPATEQVATDANNAADAAANAANSAVDSAAAAIAAAEQSARDAFGKLTAESPIADFKTALDMVPIQFDTAKSTIKAESNAILDDAAKTMKLLKAGTKVEIQGYTDSDGDDAANLQLSQDRADAVKAALVQRGVSADMLTTKGYGEANPIGDNTTEDGKAKNRRIAYDIK